MDESAVRERISRLLAAGELPKKPPERSFGGPGSGRYCRVCLDRIDVSDVEVEVDDRLVLHPSCYLLWVRAVQRSAAV